MSRLRNSLLVALVIISATACRNSTLTTEERRNSRGNSSPTRTVHISEPLVKQLVAAAIEQADYTFTYDPSYVELKYPAGDVPIDRGVCTDVIIRAFRKNGIDLQKEVHEDMARNFSVYPQKWGLSGPDSNIDHRRVLNLMTYFERQGKSLSITNNAKDYLPGDIVAWRLSGGATHIGIMTNLVSERSGVFLVSHNLSGVKIEDVLFAWRIIGHYRYF